MVFDAVVRHRSHTLSLESFRAAIEERSGSAVDTSGGTCAEDEENLFGSCMPLPTLKEANRLLIKEALHRAGGNQAIAARQIGLTRTALNRRLNRNP
jgi:transcriptional regulator with GAF, ATPase, and Fis domain